MDADELLLPDMEDDLAEARLFGASWAALDRRWFAAKAAVRRLGIGEPLKRNVIAEVAVEDARTMDTWTWAERHTQLDLATERGRRAAREAHRRARKKGTHPAT